jgi:hypothetical protein
VSHKLDWSFFLKIDQQERDSIRISNRIKKDYLIFTSLNTFSAAMFVGRMELNEEVL